MSANQSYQTKVCHLHFRLLKGSTQSDNDSMLSLYCCSVGWTPLHIIGGDLLFLLLWSVIRLNNCRKRLLDFSVLTSSLSILKWFNELIITSFLLEWFNHNFRRNFVIFDSGETTLTPNYRITIFYDEIMMRVLLGLSVTTQIYLSMKYYIKCIT